jgi:hypothetical protein
MATTTVVFKTVEDRAAFIGVQIGFLSMNGVSFELGEYKAVGYGDPRHNGQPTLVVSDTLRDLSYTELTSIVDDKAYEDARFNFDYLKCVPGSTRKLIDFIS